MVPPNKYLIHFVDLNSQITVRMVGLKTTSWLILLVTNPVRRLAQALMSNSDGVKKGQMISQ